jgi:hypothetical protein
MRIKNVDQFGDERGGTAVDERGGTAVGEDNIVLVECLSYSTQQHVAGFNWQIIIVNQWKIICCWV